MELSFAGGVHWIRLNWQLNLSLLSHSILLLSTCQPDFSLHLALHPSDPPPPPPFNLMTYAGDSFWLLPSAVSSVCVVRPRSWPFKLCCLCWPFKLCRSIEPVANFFSILHLAAEINNRLCVLLRFFCFTRLLCKKGGQ